MNTPKVSIVIPVFNGSDYMREAIDSALAQTYPNFEVIVINDGSKDNEETDRIARSYGERIRYFIKENGGVATALNLGIEKMEGEYFSWLSHDDIYKPQKIETQIRYLNALDFDTILYSNYELIDSKGKVFFKTKHEELYGKKLNVPLFPLFRFIANGCTMLIHKSHFHRVGLFNPALRTTQDYALWFKMFRDAKILFCEEILLSSRQHPGQGSYTIPSHISECDHLWMGFLRDVTCYEMCQMEGTPHIFFKNTYELLKTTPYRSAAEYCKMQADHKSLFLEKKLSSDEKDKLITMLIDNYEGLYYLKHKIKKSSIRHFFKKYSIGKLVFSIKNFGLMNTMKRIFRILK